MDPLSVTASVLAVLTAIIQSCTFITGFISNIKHTTSSIRYYQTTLRTFLILLADLQTFCGANNVGKDYTQKLHGVITACHAEVTEAEKRIRLFDMRRGWAKLKWQFARDQWMKEFFDHVHEWHVILPSHLMAMHMNMTAELKDLVAKKSSDTRVLEVIEIKETSEIPQINVVPKHNVTQLSSLPVPDSSQQKYSSQHEEALIQKRRFERFLLASVKPSSINVLSATQFSCRIFSIYIRWGSIISRQWKEGGEEVYKASRPGDDLGIGFSIRLPYWSYRRIHGFIFFLTAFQRGQSTSPFSFNISMPRVLPSKSRVFEAARRGDLTTLVKLFQSQQAYPSDTLKNGNSLLHVAASNNQTNVVRLLLEQGAYANIANDLGDTPLHLAVRLAADYDLSRLLIRYGCNLETSNSHSETPLHTFFGPVMRQLILNHWEFLDLESQDYQGRTVMHYVAWSKTSTSLELKGYHFNKLSFLDTQDNTGKTILHFAAQRGNLDLLEWLLPMKTWGANSAKDCFGRTPLHYATESRRYQAIDLLVKHGFDMNASDTKGKTIIQHAICHGTLEAVRHLLPFSAAQSQVGTDSNARILLKQAYQRKDLSIINHLEARFQTVLPDVELQGEIGNIERKLPFWAKLRFITSNQFLWIFSYIVICYLSYRIIENN